MRYVSLGNVPPKRHVQVRRDGSGTPLLVEEVLGYEGFSGNETILLHQERRGGAVAANLHVPLGRDVS